MFYNEKEIGFKDDCEVSQALQYSTVLSELERVLPRWTKPSLARTVIGEIGSDEIENLSPAWLK